MLLISDDVVTFQHYIIILKTKCKQGKDIGYNSVVNYFLKDKMWT